MAQRLRRLLAVLFFLGGVPAFAQDAMMGAAPTLEPGQLQVLAYPLVYLQSQAVHRAGLGVIGGYGLRDNIDLKFDAVFNDDINFSVGGQAKMWLIRGDRFDLSAFGGYHRRPQTNELEAGATVSREIRDGLALYGGLDLSFDFTSGNNFTLANLDVGAEYELRDDIHLYGEASLGLGDENQRFSYLAAGAAYFFKL
jgi:hypothetical protein